MFCAGCCCCCTSCKHEAVAHGRAQARACSRRAARRFASQIRALAPEPPDTSSSQVVRCALWPNRRTQAVANEHTALMACGFRGPTPRRCHAGSGNRPSFFRGQLDVARGRVGLALGPAAEDGMEPSIGFLYCVPMALGMALLRARPSTAAL